MFFLSISLPHKAYVFCSFKLWLTQVKTNKTYNLTIQWRSYLPLNSTFEILELELITNSSTYISFILYLVGRRNSNK